MKNYPWVEQANKVFIGILIIQALAAIGAGIYTDTLAMSFGITVLVLSLPFIMLKTNPFSSATHHCVGLATQAMTALHIQQGMGLTEIHFEIFTVLAFLAWYKDSRLFFSSVGFILLHHLSFFILQSNGSGVYIFEERHLMWMMVFTHGFFAIAEGTVLGIMSAHNRRESLDALQLRQAVNKILERPGTISLRAGIEAEPDKRKPFGTLISSVHEALDSIIANAPVVGQGVETVDKVNKEIKAATDESVTQVSTIASAVNQMTATIADVAQRTNEVSAASADALLNTDEAKNKMRTARDQSGELQEQLEEMGRIVEQLDNKTKEISSVMESIQAVAEQTNLLALNAAIEAARAGEHGRGFAVVADEVRALAGNTKTSTDKIREVGESLNADSRQAVQIIQSCLDIARLSSDSSTEAASSMDELVAHLDQVNNSITSVATAAEQQVAASDEIGRVAESLNQLSQSNDAQVSLSVKAVCDLKDSIEFTHQKLKAFEV